MNLPETQMNIKKGAVALIILIFIYYSGQFLILQSIAVYQRIFPPRLPEPEALFGNLPQLKMTSIPLDSEPEYILDTDDGRLPVFPDRIEVYPLVERSGQLLLSEQMQNLAADLNFTGNYTSLSASEFRWVDSTNNRSFQGHSITRHFKLETPISRLSAVVTEISTITESDAMASVTGFLRSRLLLSPEDLQNIVYRTIPTQISFSQMQETRPIPTSSRLILVNVFREIANPRFEQNQNVLPEKFPVLGPNPRKSLINFMVTNHRDVFRYPSINFAYWEANYEEGSEYYISRIQDVWNSVQQNGGVVSYVNTTDGDYYNPVTDLDISRIEIRDIYLAYYESPEFNSYLQPIYVFEGQFVTTPAVGQTSQSGEIVIYFPAVRGDQVTN